MDGLIKFSVPPARFCHEGLHPGEFNQDGHGRHGSPYSTDNVG